MTEPTITPNPAAEALFSRWGITWELQLVELANVQTVADQQVRSIEHIAPRGNVEEYAVQMAAGAPFPPLVLRRTATAGVGVMIDGNTRRTAAMKNRLREYPAYLLDLPTGALAKALGAALNNMGGARLTPDEAKQQALNMLENLGFNDAQVAEAVGVTGEKVRNWRHELAAKEHARRLDLGGVLERVPANQHKILARVKQDRPFSEMLRLAADLRVPHRALQELQQQVADAPSEQAALEAIDEARAELRPPTPAQVGNRDARRMRQVLPQVLNLAPPLDVYDPERAEEDRAAWLQVAQRAASMLAMYDQMGAADAGDHSGHGARSLLNGVQ